MHFQVLFIRVLERGGQSRQIIISEGNLSINFPCLSFSLINPIFRYIPGNSGMVGRYGIVLWAVSQSLYQCGQHVNGFSLSDTSFWKLSMAPDFSALILIQLGSFANLVRETLTVRGDLMYSGHCSREHHRIQYRKRPRHSPGYGLGVPREGSIVGARSIFTQGHSMEFASIEDFSE